MSSLRALQRALALLVFGLAAHHLAGGEMVKPLPLILYSCFILLLLWPTAGKQLTPPGMAALVVVSQSAVHLILGSGNQMASDSGKMMLLAHATSGILAYAVLQYSEKLMELPARWLLRFIKFSPSAIVHSENAVKHVHFSISSRLFGTRSLRAPPVFN